MEVDDETKTDEELHTYKTIEAKPIHLPDDYYFFKMPYYKRVLNKIVMAFITFFTFFIGHLKFAMKIRGRHKAMKGIKNQGAILVANHIHPYDAFILCSSLYPRKVFQTMLQTNLGLPGGKMARLAGGIPIPDRPNLLTRFMKELKWAVSTKKQIVSIYPEAALEPFSDHIRPFKQGAFRFACLAEVPIIPAVWTFHKPKGIYKLFKHHPSLHLTYLEPYTVIKQDSKKETVQKAMDDVHQIMSDFFEKNSEVVYKAKS